eukprot:CAMPEP_0168186238 /NCGR_PEP_ID=MMETSP0139_2-20121125/14314_1 /TAXON_ID=44445 /ORGANISM="Pseudo-nitzschia australis, Strain 10249 10 AB" /LENGTH=37 /DNA_ID= /DNA_START= /DNA_END= /DNA_ORIENTATION=
MTCWANVSVDYGVRINRLINRVSDLLSMPSSHTIVEY